MPATEPPDRTIENPGTFDLDCLCGRCTMAIDADYDDLALDACLHAAHDMLNAVECGVPPDDAGANIALQSTRGLLANARMMLCIQRQTARAGGSCAL